MNRREFLHVAAVLAAGSTVVPKGWALNEQQHAFLAAQASYIDRRNASFFSAIDRAAVAAVAEQIIPATDTPGAIEAGVPKFIELMVADWFTEEERGLFVDGLAQLQSLAGSDFAKLSQGEQLDLLERLESEAGDAPWYQLGNVTRLWDSEAPFICQIKELTVLGFMLSEVGASQFLRENPMGSFNGALPLDAKDSAYAAELPLRLVTRG